MKKTYLAPQMSIIEISSDNILLGGSVTKYDSDDTAASEALSNERAWGHNLWETEEEK